MGDRAGTILLVGCPNVGKSALFCRLTGVYAVVSNYPGTTVSVTVGRMTVAGRSVEVVDTPGLYGFPPSAEDEKLVAAELLRDKPGTVLVQVASALELPRMLALCGCLRMTGLPMCLVINMMDEARRQGVTVDLDLLEEELGIPVIGCSAVTGEGMDRVRACLDWLVDVTAAKAQRRELERAMIDCPAARERAEGQLEWARRLADRAARKEAREPAFDPDRWLLHPVWGPVLGLAAFYLVCVVFVGQLCAGMVVDWLDGWYVRVLGPAVAILAREIPWPMVGRLISGEFGLASLGLRYSVLVILPIVTGFFVAFSLLEDVGYLPRLAALSDRLLRPLGVGGPAAIPLSLGLGCGTMAAVFVRILPTARERTVATFLLALAVPCSAQLGVIAALLSPWPGAMAIWGLTVGLSGAGAARIASRLLPGKPPALVLELPPIRWPRAGNVLAKVSSRVRWYGREVVPLLAGVSIVLWALDEFGLLEVIIRGLAVVCGWARLPPELAPSLLLGFFRRDYGAAGLFALRDRLTPGQLTVAAVMLTLSFPCVAQLVVIVRERGARTGALIAGGVAVTALAVSVCLGRLLL